MSDTERAAEAEAIRSKLIVLEEYRKLLNGRELTSNWLVVDQSMIDTFVTPLEIISSSMSIRRAPRLKLRSEERLRTAS